SLLYVSPSQINFVSPPGMSAGFSIIALYDGEKAVQAGVVQVFKTNPSIFTANANGAGVPSAVIVRVQGNSPGTYESVAQFDTAQNKYIPLPIDLGPESDSVFLSLFGTGWRGASTTREAIVKFFPDADELNPFEAPVQYVGKQPTIEGLDQINVLLPRT